MQVAAILELTERDSIALRGHAEHRAADVAVASVEPRAGRPKTEARKRTRSVHRQSTLERHLIAAEPTREHRPHVELRIRSKTVVTTHVEESARVFVARTRREPGRTRSLRGRRDRAERMLDVAADEQNRLRL